MVIRRDFYLEKPIQWKGNGLIKIIAGIRRCGKSYLLNNLSSYSIITTFISHEKSKGASAQLPMPPLFFIYAAFC